MLRGRNGLPLPLRELDGSCKQADSFAEFLHRIPRPGGL